MMTMKMKMTKMAMMPMTIDVVGLSIDGES